MADIDGSEELERLRAHCHSLESELAALKERDSHLAELSARLDALVRSSNEVRYMINADWSELAQLAGGGFIPDTNAANPNWLDEYIPSEHRALVRAEIKRSIEAKDTYNIEHLVNRADGTVGWALSRAVPLFDDKGEIIQWLGAASDITDRKRWEERQKMLNSELAHRIKNILAIVQGLTSRTLRQAETLDGGRRAIEARLAALGRAQDILRREGTTEADIRDVVLAALAPHQSAGDRILVDGPALNLDSQQALGLSLAVHELATNAAKYGALSTDGGRITISWGNAAGTFQFNWIEQDGPLVAKPDRYGFGSTLIEKLVASYFRGKGQVTYDPAGIQFTLTGTLDRPELLELD